jgi:hypothetical protein
LSQGCLNNTPLLANRNESWKLNLGFLAQLQFP